MSLQARFILGFSLLAVGAILLIIRGIMSKKALAIPSEDFYKDDYGGFDLEKAKELKIKETKNIPGLERWNGGIAGSGMSGHFPRKGVIRQVTASYNCFYILFCPILILGCFLVDGYADHSRVRSICELEKEKDEAFCVLSKGWGSLFMIAGAILVLANLS